MPAETATDPAPATPPVMTLAEIGEELKRWCGANLRSIHYASLVVHHLDGASDSSFYVVPPPPRPDVLEARDLRAVGIMLGDASQLGDVLGGFGLRLPGDYQENSARVTFSNAGEVVREYVFPSLEERAAARAPESEAEPAEAAKAEA